MNDLLPSTEEMYEALLSKNSQYEGVFIAGVKTTGIFCRPTCHARKPKKENVEFFGDTKAALALGYRACKVCNPMEVSEENQNGLNTFSKKSTNDQLKNGRIMSFKC